MIDLDFAVLDVAVASSSATPTLAFKLCVTNKTPALAVEHVSLQVQIRIEAAQRSYNPRERERLVELFGTAEDWDRSLRGLLWTTASAAIPRFTDSCTIDLPVACSTDCNIAAAKYFDGVVDGEAPLLLLFSGAIFYRDTDENLQITQVPHHNEASFHLPVRIWHAMMQHYYPDSVWLRVERALFDDLCRYKRQAGLASVDDALRRLVAAAPAAGAS